MRSIRHDFDRNMTIFVLVLTWRAELLQSGRSRWTGMVGCNIREQLFERSIMIFLRARCWRSIYQFRKVDDFFHFWLFCFYSVNFADVFASFQTLVEYLLMESDLFIISVICSSINLTRIALKSFPILYLCERLLALRLVISTQL